MSKGNGSIAKMDLNIITLNIPFPPDYGGMIDTYYRLKSLHDLGVHIHLHCFEYGRSRPKELESICETVNYYHRRSGPLILFSGIPYIVNSRTSKRLMDNLAKNDYPVLFDGLHTTYYLKHPALSSRKKLVRAHNIEHRYYRTRAEIEGNFFKKSFFRLESLKLQYYEQVLRNADHVLTISDFDQDHFDAGYHNSVFLPPFHPFSDMESLPGTGDYIIYHGDLSVNENAAIADYLISKIFAGLPYRSVIAGKDPPRHIKSHASRFRNIEVVANPDTTRMKSLIENAQINLLPALFNNGFKLKILMALFSGRHCLGNSAALADKSVRSLVHEVNTDEEIIRKIHQLMKEPFTGEMISARGKVLSEFFNNIKNAKKLIDLLSP